MEKNRESYLLGVINHYLSTYSELLQSSGSVSMETPRWYAIESYEAFKVTSHFDLLTKTFLWKFFF